MLSYYILDFNIQSFIIIHNSNNAQTSRRTKTDYSKTLRWPKIIHRIQKANNLPQAG